MAVTPEDIRSRISDTALDNVPIYLAYLTDEEIEKCIEDIVDDFNEAPPTVWRKYHNDSEFPSKALLLTGACYEALKKTELKELRKEMQYTDGGVSSSVYYKSPQFKQIKQELQAEYESKKTRLKRELNIKACYGGM